MNNNIPKRVGRAKKRTKSTASNAAGTKIKQAKRKASVVEDSCKPNTRRKQTRRDARRVAKRYVSYGWAPIPVPPQSKAPEISGWQSLRVSSRDVGEHFDEDDNIGVLLGEPSGGLVDVDLDHPLAVELAPEFLPQTDSIFGRAGKARSHWLYVAEGAKTRKHSSRDHGMIVELRSSGCQTVFPGSIHPSGERITWAASGEPAVVDAVELRAAVAALANEVEGRLGMSRAQTNPTKRTQTAVEEIVEEEAPIEEGPLDPVASAEARKRARIYVRYVPGVATGNRNNRAYHLSQTLLNDFALDRDTAWVLLTEWNRTCNPPLDESEGAELETTFLSAEEREPQLPRGNRLEFTRNVDDPDVERRHAKDLDPVPTARSILTASEVDGLATLRYWRGGWWEWSAGAYRAVAENEVSGRLWRELGISHEQLSRNIVGNVYDALRAHAALPSKLDAPAWLGDGPRSWEPNQILATRDALVHLPGVERGRDYKIKATPQFFGLSAIDYDYDEEAPHPLKWQEFLRELWGDDVESIATLQEFFGYVLSGDTRQQKMLLVVGPRRSGKGTIARVLTAIVGKQNVADPPLGSLATNFGLQALIGKSLAIIPDARLSGRTDQSAIVERLLTISGEDGITIDRKNRDHWHGTLSARFALLTNELPRLADSSGALASRMIVLRLTKSFLGREDLQLTDDLLGERAGILNWAIIGLNRLQKRGRFLQPASGSELLAELTDLSSPIGAFLSECCIVDSELNVPIRAIFNAWRRWCKSKGRKEPGTEQSFGRDLRAVCPSIRRSKPRDSSGRQVGTYEGLGLVER